MDPCRPPGRHARLPSHARSGPFTRIAAAAAGQHGLITTADLRRCGFSSSATSRWVRLGRIERIAPCVYRLASAPSTWHQRALAGVLAGPETTVLSHRAAAALHGMRGFHRDLIEVTSNRWRRARPPEVRVHESLVLPARDLVVVDGIPTTDRVRTIIDLGAVSHPFKIGLALDEERRRGTVTMQSVASRLEELAVQGRNGIRSVRDLLEARAGERLATTAFEQLFLDIVDRFGLPRPEHQWRVVDDGFVAVLDFAYPDRLIAIEADSEKFHLDLSAFHHDRTRQNRLTLLGWSFLRFTDRHLRSESRNVANQVCLALGLRFPLR
jgi:predicted transcriptional regulator of viral defense system